MSVSQSVNEAVSKPICESVIRVRQPLLEKADHHHLELIQTKIEVHYLREVSVAMVNKCIILLFTCQLHVCVCRYDRLLSHRA